MRERRRMRWIWSALLALAASAAHAAALPAGRPFVETYLPTELGVYPQNFSIAVDNDGVVYLGNSEGVLEFDGARWRLIELPSRRHARALATDADGRVYVGSAGSFGYLERASDGTARFVDLTPADYTREQRVAMGDIWDIVPTREAVYFRGVHDFFVWHRDGAVSATHIQRGFGASFRDGAIVYLIRRGQGLARLDDERFTLLPGGEKLADVRTIAAIDRGGGEFLLGVNDGRWLKLDRSGVGDFDPRGTALPTPDSIFATRALPDGRTALGNSDGKMILLSADLSSAREFAIDSTMVSDFAPARDGGLWVATYLGLYHVAVSSPWSYLNDRDGLAGEVFDAIEVDGRTLVASTAGLYAQLPKPDELGRSFARMPYALGEVWDLEPHAGGALVAGSYKLFRVAGNAAPQPVTETIYPRLMTRSRDDPAILLVGGETGFHIVRADPKGEARTLASFVDFEHRVFPIEEIAPREFWLSTDSNGVFRARLSQDWTRIESLEHFGAEHGLKLDAEGTVTVSRIGERFVFATALDLFEFRDGRFVPLHAPEIEGLPARDGSLKFRSAGDGSGWAVAPKHLFHRAPGGDWHGAALGTLGPLAINEVIFGPAGSVLVSITGGLVRYDGRPEPRPPAAARVLLRAVHVQRGEGDPQGLAIGDARAALGAGVATLRLDYALPRFAGARPTEYRTRLVGLDPAWSPWSRVATQTYTHLGAGDYTFEVQGRDAGGNAVPARWRFAIAPPWYRSGAAYVAWTGLALLALAALVALAVRRRTATLERRNRSLESLISERTHALELRSRELELANRQLRDLADRDGLTGVANRRRLDSVLESACQQARADGLPLAALMVDVDHFKAYNDRRGHLEGDRALRALAEDLKRFADHHDGIVARYGGEEFALILLGKDAGHAGTIAEELRRDTADGELGRFGLTVSVGVATARGNDAQPVMLLQRADAALYRAKRGGRNRVATA